MKLYRYTGPLTRPGYFNDCGAMDFILTRKPLRARICAEHSGKYQMRFECDPKELWYIKIEHIQEIPEDLFS